jgi:hypothetical protein
MMQPCATRCNNATRLNTVRAATLCDTLNALQHPHVDSGRSGHTYRRCPTTCGCTCAGTGTERRSCGSTSSTNAPVGAHTEHSARQPHILQSPARACTRAHKHTHTHTLLCHHRRDPSEADAVFDHPILRQGGHPRGRRRDPRMHTHTRARAHANTHTQASSSRAC